METDDSAAFVIVKQGYFGDAGAGRNMLTHANTYQSNNEFLKQSWNKSHLKLAMILVFPDKIFVTSHNAFKSLQSACLSSLQDTALKTRFQPTSPTSMEKLHTKTSFTNSKLQTLRCCLMWTSCHANTSTFDWFLNCLVKDFFH